MEFILSCFLFVMFVLVAERYGWYITLSVFAALLCAVCMSGLVRAWLVWGGFVISFVFFFA